MDQSDDDVWKTTDMGWGVHPEGMRKMLNYIQVGVLSAGCCLLVLLAFAVKNVCCLCCGGGGSSSRSRSTASPAGSLGLCL